MRQGRTRELSPRRSGRRTKAEHRERRAGRRRVHGFLETLPSSRYCDQVDQVWGYTHWMSDDLELQAKRKAIRTFRAATTLLQRLKRPSAVQFRTWSIEEHHGPRDKARRDVDAFALLSVRDREVVACVPLATKDAAGSTFELAAVVQQPEQESTQPSNHKQPMPDVKETTETLTDSAPAAPDASILECRMTHCDPVEDDPDMARRVPPCVHSCASPPD
jgi:hypothetical protein